MGRTRSSVAFVLAFAFVHALCFGAREVEAVLRFKKVHSWGDNARGENGRGTATGNGECDSGEIVEFGWDLEGTVKKIAAGLNHAVMITEDGAAYAWGANTCGQTGTGNFDATMRPVRILTDVVVDDVAVGSQHTLALARDGRLFAFGCNGRGALGRNPSTLDVTATPVEVSTPETFVSVAAAGAHSVGLTAGGAVYTWGANHEGQLGLGGCVLPGGPGGDPCLNDIYSPTKVVSTDAGSVLPPIKLIAAGGGPVSTIDHAAKGGHTVAVTTTNVVYAWGDNFSGQLGVRQVYYNASTSTTLNNTHMYTPNKFDQTLNKFYNRHEKPMLVEAHSIAVASGTSVQAEKSVLPGIKGIDAGNAHTIMLLETGEIFTWGDNFYGQLGLGYASRDNTPNSFYLTRNYLEPQMIDRPTRIKKFDHVQSTIGANNSQIIFTTVTGTVQEDSATFVQVSAGGDVSMALTASNRLFVWGDNSKGQLGVCGCGGCAEYGGGDTGSCTLTSVGETCPCNCGGLGTCYQRMSATLQLNQGRCAVVGPAGFEKPMCNCTRDLLKSFKTLTQDNNDIGMEGNIEIMDSPMVSDMSFTKSFTTVTLVAVGGGGCFAVSESDCKDDVNGVTCSGNGRCLSDGSCSCNPGAGGDTCENECPQGTDADKEALARYGLIDNVVGKECSGHGTCNAVTALCECDPEFFGPRCSYICRRDENMNICSGNGTCVYTPEITVAPYCVCDRFQNDDECKSRGLQMYSQGWCSYHGGEVNGGFQACFSAGSCGNCESPAAPRLPRPFRLLAALILTTLFFS